MHLYTLERSKFSTCIFILCVAIINQINKSGEQVFQTERIASTKIGQCEIVWHICETANAKYDQNVMGKQQGSDR